MMGLENCQIIFDNTSTTYFPGQIVSGKVDFNFNSTKKVRGISISFKGEANVHWTETENYKVDGKSKTRSVSYNGHEEYFSTSYYVLGGANSDSIELPFGKHVFPFTTTLPNFLPSSFEGEKGYIRYTVKATLDRPWKFDQTIKAAFTVISHLDCNSNERAREPVTLTMEKYLCCLCCREGPITGVLKLPCTAYVSGQAVPYTVEIDNASKTEVEEIKIKIKKAVTYHSQTPRRKTKSSEVTVAEFVVGPGVQAQKSKTFSDTFTLPVLPPSSLQNCRIIDLEYELKVQVEIEGFHKNMIGKIPVMIGTIPLMNMVPLTALSVTAPEESSIVTGTESFNTRQPLLGWVPGPSMITVPTGPVAPIDPSLLPPPSYEECQFGTKSILDASDSKYTMLNSDRCYAPSYPVYNFNAMPMSTAPPVAGGTTMMPITTQPVGGIYMPPMPPVPANGSSMVPVPLPSVSNVMPCAPKMDGEKM